MNVAVDLVFARRAARSRRRALGGLVVAGSLLLASCSTSGGDDDAKVDSTSTTTVAPGDVTTTTAGGGTDDGSGSDSGSGSGSGSGGGSDSGGGSTGAAPNIDSFSTPEDIDCHNGDFQEFTASWSTTGAEKVTISIDGPGVYKTYGPSGSDSLPFNCSSSHTFLLTAIGAGGKTATKTITLQPRNAQTSVPEDDMGDGIDEETPTTSTP